MNGQNDPTENWPEPNTQDLPEAPASANVKMWISGYGVMFTMRGNRMYDVISNLLSLIETAKEKGWAITWPKDINQPVQAVTQTQEQTPARVCKIHNVTMQRKFSEKKNKYYYSHANGEELCFGHP